MAVLTKIKSSNIADNAITSTKIADDAVTTIKIADSTGSSDGVTTAKIATDAVTAVKVADDVATQAELDASGIPGITSTGAASTDLVTVAGNLTVGGSYIKLPSINTDARDLLTPAAAMLIFNSTLDVIQQRASSAWHSILPITPEVTSVTPIDVASEVAGNVTFTVIGKYFNTGDGVTFLATSGSDITSGITTTRVSETQLTVVVANASFIGANEPYSVKVTTAGGISATLSNVVRVDNAPSWATYVGTLTGTPPVVAHIYDTAPDATHATVSATDSDGDTVSYAVDGTNTLATAGMSLNATTGAITGTPINISTLTNYDFNIKASSTTSGGTLKFTLQSFRFTLSERPFNLFAPLVYTGTGAALSLTFNETNLFQPDVVWTKSTAVREHQLYTSMDYPNKKLIWGTAALNAAELGYNTTAGSITSFDTDGFTLGSDAGGNTISETYVVQAWQAGGEPSADKKVMTDGTETNAIAGNGNNSNAGYLLSADYGNGISTGSHEELTQDVLNGTVSITKYRRSVNTVNKFSIISFTSGDNTDTKGLRHGLGATPEFMIMKTTAAETAADAEGKWWVWHYKSEANLNSTYEKNYFDLSTEEADTDSDDPWSNMMVNANTDKYIYVGAELPGAGADAICLCWIAVSGVSDFGVYTGDGNSTQTIAFTSTFTPRFVLIKNEAVDEPWIQFNSLRGGTKAFESDKDAAEDTSLSSTFIYESNGFTVGDASDYNANGDKYIYAAWA